ncbi:unnamed protein product [Meganyctiphanes norvegica]|uniref:C-type lectin domain-containing protein n=1 Tax=Meganyctiphanes norvegica TaxID=48144 RepID=A0AAV2Q3W7_MEGNR
MNLIIISAFSALVINLHIISTFAGTCSDPWVAVWSKCVLVSADPMSWWDSHDYCATLSTNQGNGMLASMPDCLDFAELTYYMGFASASEGGSFWVGAHTEFTANNWKWLTMESLRTGVPFWAYTEGHDEDEDCAAVDSQYYYQLADYNCDELKRAVCMVEQENYSEFKRFERSYEILDCPSESTQVGDHCYHFSSNYESRSWADAENRCQNPTNWDHGNPGELFSPSTCEEFSHMAHHLETHGDIKYWVGAVDVTGYNEWSWVSGDTIPSGAPYWAYGQPNHESDGKPRHHCAFMDAEKRRYLNDNICSSRLRYICEVFTS